MIKLLKYCLLILVLTGCTTYWYGSLSSSLAIPPEKYYPVKTVSGQVSTYLFLGLIGGSNHSDIIQEAKSNLIRLHPLDSNQVFGNWAVSIKNTWAFFGRSQIFKVSADIISLVPITKKTPNLSTLVPQKGSLPPIETVNGELAKLESGSLAQGDSVLFLLKDEQYRGLIGAVHNSWVSVSYLNGKGKLMERNLKINLITHKIKH